MNRSLSALWMIGGLFVLTACTRPGIYSPQDLAKEQWESCSHFPSVELVEISPAGELVIRDRHFSTPPAAYQRCVAEIGYEQLQSGRRDATTLVRDAYFVHAEPERRTLSKTGGQYPERIDVFTAGQAAVLFFVIEGSNSPKQLTFDWIAPSGKSHRATRAIGPVSTTHIAMWSTEAFNLPQKSAGRWKVNMFIQGYLAGEYSFTVR